VSIGTNGLNLIKHFEQCRLEAFKPIPTDPWTIGWGRTRAVRQGDTCTQEQADQWLIEDVRQAEDAVERGTTEPLTQNQFDALTSFIYNCGETAFWSSTMRKLLNNGADRVSVADQLLRWNKSKGVVLAGLTRRREAERKLFLTPDLQKFVL
jgi:lysozyme